MVINSEFIEEVIALFVELFDTLILSKLTYFGIHFRELETIRDLMDMISNYTS